MAPDIEQDILQQLMSSRPPLVVFEREELVNDQFLTREWGRRVYDYLRQEYVQLDESSPLLANVFVTPERVDEARRALEQAGLYPDSGEVHEQRRLQRN